MVSLNEARLTLSQFSEYYAGMLQRGCIHQRQNDLCLPPRRTCTNNEDALGTTNTARMPRIVKATASSGSVKAGGV